MSWLFELKNQTKNDDLKLALEEIECLLKKPKDPFHKTNEIFNNAIERQTASEDEAEYYDDEPDGKTFHLMNLKVANLPCPEEMSDPTELPLSKESISFDMSLVKVFASSANNLRVSVLTFSVLLIVFIQILKFC